MKNKFLKGLVASFALTVSAIANAGIITIGGYDNPLNKNSGIGSYLSDSSYFDTFGVDGFQMTTDGVVSKGSLTSSYLSNIDIFWSGLPFGTMQQTEADALYDFINDGGTVIVNNDRSTAGSFRQFQPLFEMFDIFFEDDPIPLNTINVASSNHPLVNGPFGQVNDIAMSDAIRFTTTNSEFDTLGTWDDDGDGAFGVLGPSHNRKGALIILPDWEATGTFFSFNLTDPNTGVSTQPSASTLGLNAWAYASNLPTTDIPEPSTLAIFALGLMGLASRKFKKQA